MVKHTQLKREIDDIRKYYVSKLLVKLKFAFKIRNQIQHLQKIKSVDTRKAVPEYRGRSQMY